jgi:hypothetical protein
MMTRLRKPENTSVRTVSNEGEIRTLYLLSMSKKLLHLQLICYPGGVSGVSLPFKKTSGINSVSGDRSNTAFA